MKSKILKSALSLLVVFGSGLTSLNVNASNNEFLGNEIPDEMQPYSEILYTSDNTYKVLKGGHVEEESKTKLELPEKYANANEEFVIVETIIPVEGMIVTYASDGLIFDIVFPEGHEDVAKQLNTYSSRAAVLPDGLSLVATWGSYPNKLYYDSISNEIHGVGRATTFSDTIGQGNHTLKKGDVATKLAYDNCKLGSTVRVYTKNSSGTYKTINMTKWDAGGMPNAVLDIWKTGVEYWGYTWNSSFSMPNQVTIFHTNLDVNGNPIY